LPASLHRRANESEQRDTKGAKRHLNISSESSDKSLKGVKGATNTHDFLFILLTKLITLRLDVATTVAIDIAVEAAPNVRESARN
jgi:hypothetical protein